MTEWHASDYSHQSGLQQEMAEEQLSLLTLEGAERILDVGCAFMDISYNLVTCSTTGVA